MGVTSGLVPMYLMEITPTKYRGSAGTCHMVHIKFLIFQFTSKLFNTLKVAVAFSDWFSMLMALPEVHLK